jgi:hypothetical protein
MYDIYKDAQRVFACVGPHYDDSEFLLDVLCHTEGGHQSPDQFFATSLSNDSEDRRKEVSFMRALPRLGPRTVSKYCDHIHAPRAKFEYLRQYNQALSSFEKREYWQRLWIVQELRAAKSTYVLCGLSMIDLPIILLHTAVREPYTLLSSSNGTGATGTLPKSIIGAIFYGTRSMLTPKQPRGSRPAPLGPAKLSIENVFQCFRHFKCSNFRDRVYAMLHVIDWGERDGQEKFKPDYGITKIELLVQIAQFLKKIPTADLTARRLSPSEGLFDVLSELFGISKDPEVLESVHKRIWEDSRQFQSLTVNARWCYTLRVLPPDPPKIDFMILQAERQNVSTWQALQLNPDDSSECFEAAPSEALIEICDREKCRIPNDIIQARFCGVWKGSWTHCPLKDAVDPNCAVRFEFWDMASHYSVPPQPSKEPIFQGGYFISLDSK